MEDLHVDVIGNILSHLRAARDVVVASATCKKWREAFQHHLSSLTFHDLDFSGFTTNELESIITQTIQQTKGLQRLKFFLSDVDDVFCADHVLVWLMHARDTLRELYLLVRAAGSCQKFPCLKTLRLEDVSARGRDFSFLVSLFPKIENLTLVNLDVYPEAIISLISVSLKSIDVVEMALIKFILEADSLGYLHLQRCNFEHFEHFKLIGKGTLKVLNIDVARIAYVDIQDNMENLEIVDVNESSIKVPKLYNMISKLSNLRRLRLQRVNFDNVDEVIDLESISATFPQLTRQFLYPDVED
ncbi:hypothetical protein SLEP1_g40471 [Rubroshorea leprosula]|uniref:F-box/LRR-repeat protein 15/At3g58940/PEG3-like LRR domain-containing protein n=1 Tax=Rubroshorea leprosula TaxID=152421 RepID=A0AAV5L3N4_9ROSI|nr:hypothetical protein SLEP1_g40471 [Rubroshorea leprosula]